MPTSSSPPAFIARKLPTVLLFAVSGGAFGGTVLGRELLDLSVTGQTALWLAFAAIGASAGWSTAPATAPQARTRWAIGLVIAAIAGEVLIVDPWNAIVAVALVAGACGLVVQNRRQS